MSTKHYDIAALAGDGIGPEVMAVAKDVLDRNSKIEQNNEWGGTFDPLK